MTVVPLRKRKREQGIALALVLVLIILMITAVYTFSRRAVINVTIAQNRSDAAEADALARGGLRMAEAILYLVRLKEQADDAAGGAGNPASGTSPGNEAPPVEADAWTQLSGVPLIFANGGRLTFEIEEVGARLNLNALVPPATGSGDEDGGRDENEDGEATGGTVSDEALEYLVLVLRHVIEGIAVPPEEKNYDERALAENLLDYMDADDASLSGRGEDDYYRRQEPPYAPRNGPFLSFDEIALVEGVDAQLLSALRDYVTVYPIGSTAGIDLNRAPPWVLPLVYAGPSGDRELLSERRVRRILSLREKGKILCSDVAADPARCVTLSEAGLDEGSIYPEATLPLPVSVFRVEARARVGGVERGLEAIFDTRPTTGPQMLSFRRLRGS